ncbi:olfactory receptor 5I1-like [Ascaphus truei]|uniref:olfactory receptor 5I1-like n=1 Tax=Ascaphus truei TaxID=8439 RepID=UPI003F5A1016
MERRNQSHPEEFLLLGLFSNSEFDILLFILFTVTYITALLANLTIFLTIVLCSSLQTPMYFFLTNLSVLDICCISTTVPKMLYNFVMASSTITFYGCVTQLYVFTWVVITEMLLLTYMAFDRYVAICKPLHYSLIITRRVCFHASISIWTLGAFSSAVHTSMTFLQSFCDSQEINHFFCEIPQLLKLSCTDTKLNYILLFITDLFLGVACFLFIFVSYFFIISSILHIRSGEGKRRATSTCTSHITVVVIYYGTLFFAYIKPHSASFVEQDKVLSVIYAVFIPLLNPLIYSLRNRDMAEALTKLCNRIIIYK